MQAAESKPEALAMEFKELNLEDLQSSSDLSSCDINEKPTVAEALPANDINAAMLKAKIKEEPQDINENTKQTGNDDECLDSCRSAKIKNKGRRLDRWIIIHDGAPSEDEGICEDIRYRRRKTRRAPVRSVKPYVLISFAVIEDPSNPGKATLKKLPIATKNDVAPKDSQLSQEQHDNISVTSKPKECSKYPKTITLVAPRGGFAAFNIPGQAGILKDRKSVPSNTLAPVEQNNTMDPAKPFKC